MVHVAIARRRGPGQQNRPATLLGHVEVTWEIWRLLHQQVDCCLVLTVGVRGYADVVAAVHVARLDDPQLGGDVTRCVHRIVHRVPNVVIRIDLAVTNTPAKIKRRVSLSLAAQYYALPSSHRFLSRPYCHLRARMNR